MIPNCTAQKMKFSIKDFFWKCDQIRGKLWIWSHLLKKSLMKNFIFCAWRKVSKTSSYKHQLSSKFLSVNAHCVKSVQIRNFFGSYFPVFGLNTEIYGVNMDQKKTKKYRKIRTRKNSVLKQFTHREALQVFFLPIPLNRSRSNNKGNKSLHV